MNRLLMALSLSLCGFFGCMATKNHKPTASQHSIGQAIETIIKNTDKDVNVGIKIVALSDGKTVYEKNAQRHFVPGSTIKLITLAAALHYLGPAFRFTTTIYTDAPVDAHGHVANLYIQGSGDPSLMDNEVMALIDEMRQMGIKKVSGDISIDDSIFDKIPWGKGAMWDDRNRGFSAPTAGLNLNYNRLLIKTSPSIAGGKAFATMRPAQSFAPVQNHITTKNGAQKQIELIVERDNNKEYDWPKDPMDGLHLGDKIMLSGYTGLGAAPHYSSLAISDPGIFVGYFIKDELKRFGIKFTGNINRKAKPNKAVRLVSHESRSLAEALVDFTKISNNLGNDVLIKAIAAYRGNKPGTFSEGLKLIQDFLKNEVHIEPNSLIAADGAGLSRYNLVTPDQMVKLLLYAANHFHMAPEFIAALPIGGEDGLLRSRLTDEALRKNVRAKTGSFTGVSCLAGYLTGPDGSRYAFSTMVNGFIGPVAKYNLMQDQILSTMIIDDQELAKAK